MLHGDRACSPGQIGIFGGRVGIVGIISLAVMERISLFGEQNFDLSKLAVVDLVGRAVGKGVVVRSLLGSGSDGFTDAVRVVERLASSCSRKLNESVAFGGLLTKNLHVLWNHSSRRDYAVGGKILRINPRRSAHAARTVGADAVAHEAPYVNGIDRYLRFSEQIGDALDFVRVVGIVHSRIAGVTRCTD